MTERVCANADELRFAEAVRCAREQRRWPQARIAEAMNARGWSWHQSTVYRVERGSQPARIGEAVALAEILGIDLNAFAGGDPAPWRACLTCAGQPPAGFTCDACGKSGTRAAS